MRCGRGGGRLSGGRQIELGVPTHLVTAQRAHLRGAAGETDRAREGMCTRAAGRTDR
jgi:hypothetical protein